MSVGYHLYKAYITLVFLLCHVAVLVVLIVCMKGVEEIIIMFWGGHEPLILDVLPLHDVAQLLDLLFAVYLGKLMLDEIRRPADPDEPAT